VKGEKEEKKFWEGGGEICGFVKERGTQKSNEVFSSIGNRKRKKTSQSEYEKVNLQGGRGERRRRSQHYLSLGETRGKKKGPEGKERKTWDLF